MREFFIGVMQGALLVFMWLFGIFILVPVQVIETYLVKKRDELDLAAELAAAERRTRNERNPK